jgi:hypothetical protein
MSSHGSGAVVVAGLVVDGAVGVVVIEGAVVSGGIVPTVVVTDAVLVEMLLTVVELSPLASAPPPSKAPLPTALSRDVWPPSSCCVFRPGFSRVFPVPPWSSPQANTIVKGSTPTPPTSVTSCR